MIAVVKIDSSKLYESSYDKPLYPLLTKGGKEKEANVWINLQTFVTIFFSKQKSRLAKVLP